jgi:hypothetical protein
MRLWRCRPSRPAYRRHRAGGYALADALAACAVAAVAGVCALQLLSQSTSAIRESRDRLAAVELADRLYEKARLEDRASLVSDRIGSEGALRWRRTGMETASGRQGVVRLDIVVSGADRTERARLQAVLQPIPDEPTASRSPKS